MIPSCGLHRSFNKLRNQDRDTLPNQSSSDTNMQSGMSTESPMAVPIDVRALSSIDKQKHAKLAFSYLFQVTFLSATLWICLRRAREG